MLTGFRAGADRGIGVGADDFTGTRRAWAIPAGVAPLGRVFPAGRTIDAGTTVKSVLTGLDRACAPVFAADMTPFVSLKTSVPATVDGRLDGLLTAVGRWAAAHGSVWVTVWHEPENDTMAAPGTDFRRRAANFVAVHTRAYQQLKSAAGDAVQVGPTYMAYKWLPGSPETADGAVAAAWQVPAPVRDFVACDTYTSVWSWNLVGDTLSRKRDFQRWLTVLDVPADQLVIAERGIARNGPGGTAAQARVLAADYTYLDALGARALLYWNSTGAVDASAFQLAGPARSVFASVAAAAAKST